MKYILTQKMQELLAPYEGSNGLQIFDSSEKGFVLGFGMTKEDAIKCRIIEKQEDNLLYNLCENNSYIPHEWIKKNLSLDDYTKFNKWMIGQAQNEYGVFNEDVERFLKINNL